MLEFDIKNPQKNRYLLDNEIPDSEIDSVDMAEVVDTQSYENLLTIYRDLDLVTLKLYYYISKIYDNTSGSFIVDEKIKDTIKSFFGESAWDREKNQNIKILKNHQVEIRLI
jgi:hypothetical protein